VRWFADALGTKLAAAYPKEMTMEGSIAKRRGRVYLDPFRNGFAQTVVAPFCVRRSPRAPVSTPLAWSEVKPTLDPTEFNLSNFDRRLAKRDPWADFWKHRQDLKPAIRALKRL
jgi:bifunctional non-homologous end joining protein LigD